MHNHTKKMIAPIIIAICLGIYYLGFAVICMFIDDFPLYGKVLFGIIPLALVGVVIYVLVKRIKEIRSGEEDDLSKY